MKSQFLTIGIWPLNDRPRNVIFSITRERHIFMCSIEFMKVCELLHSGEHSTQQKCLIYQWFSWWPVACWKIPLSQNVSWTFFPFRPPTEIRALNKNYFFGPFSWYEMNLESVCLSLCLGLGGSSWKIVFLSSFSKTAFVYSFINNPFTPYGVFVWQVWVGLGRGKTWNVILFKMTHKTRSLPEIL